MSAQPGGQPNRLHLVQLAGGKGLRVGGDTPKQFRETGQGLLFAVSLREFLEVRAETGRVVSITVTAAPRWSGVIRGELQNIFPVDSFGTSRPDISIHLAKPGTSRTESTWHALQVVAAEESPQAGDLVAVHDAARPFATANLLGELMQAARQAGAAVPGVPVADTILQTDRDHSAAVDLPRDSLVAVQTPQVFRWELLLGAHSWAAENQRTFTDDGGLVAAFGTGPVVVPGEQGNWKVTTDGDWRRAVGLLA